MMIRKLEHERDKLSNQLEKSQEAASHAKKMAKEGEMAIKSATANCTRLENELNRLAQARFQFQTTYPKLYLESYFTHPGPWPSRLHIKP